MVGVGIGYKGTLEERMFRKIEPHSNGECWQWVAAYNRDGYGEFWRDGQMRRAHREVYQFMVGEIPDGLHCDHLCGVRSCVNPYHLDLVPKSVNSKRRWETQW